MATHTNARPFKCATCKKAFKTKHVLTVHENTHSNTKNFSCPVCAKTFKNAGGLREHAKRHSEKRPTHTCHICLKELLSACSLQKHIHTHLGIKMFSCSECDSSFVEKADRDKHVNNIHKKERNHQCSFCHKKYFSLALLRSHQRIHTQEKPFECRFCPKTFSQRTACKAHEKTHMDLAEKLGRQ